MRLISPYSQWLLEMWDSTPEGKVLDKQVDGEDVVYTLDIDGSPYQITLLTHRQDPEDKGSNISLEIHFGSRTSVESPFDDSLTGRNNMQRVMGNVWWAIKDWAKRICKGGKISVFIVGAKSEAAGDGRRAKIYGDFLMRKAKTLGVEVLETKDATDLWRRMLSITGRPNTEFIVTMYYVDPISSRRLAEA